MERRRMRQSGWIDEYDAGGVRGKFFLESELTGRKWVDSQLRKGNIECLLVSQVMPKSSILLLR
jgi:hypothetical protein